MRRRPILFLWSWFSESLLRLGFLWRRRLLRSSLIHGYRYDFGFQHLNIQR